MRIFNASHTQHYVHHEIDIKPGFTEVPKEREESARELIKKYPHHLSEGGTAPAELKEKTDLLALQAGKIKTLESQVERLQKLLTEPSDDLKAAESRAAAAEERAAQAERRIRDLTEERNEARTDAQRGQERIEVLESRVSELEAAATPSPEAAATDAAPAAEAPPAVEPPAKTEAKKRAR